MPFPQWVGRFQQEQMPLGGNLGAEPSGRRKEGPGQEQTQVESEANPSGLPRGESSLRGPGTMKLREQPLRRPSCEVLGADQITQALTFPTLTQ